MKRSRLASLAPVCLMTPGGAAACVFGATYNLPIPFGMYASGAAAALGASFVIAGFMLKAVPHTSLLSTAALGQDRAGVARLPRNLVDSLRVASVFGLALTVATGIFGTQIPVANFGMTFFWILFALGLTYATALIGDIFAVVNPWHALCCWLEWIDRGAFSGRVRYPPQLGYYPAVLLYMGFIWLELFGEVQPLMMAVVLIAYTALNLGAAWLIGKENWFRYGEFFSVFFRLVGKLAPVEYTPTGDREFPYRVKLRKPFVGLLDAPAEHTSLLVFTIFMLSSTAFDGVHNTLAWVQLYWKNIHPLLAAVIDRPYVFFVSAYYAWQSAMLFFSPFIYCAVYVLFIWLAKKAAHSDLPIRTLALRFALTLVPIAFVYNVTHYYADLLVQGAPIVRMASDPFDLGWDLFGTANAIAEPIVLDAGGIWHTQVGLILFGHVASVYLAHVEALKVFPTRRNAFLSQLPMLLLMVLLTTIGLWILSLPINAGQVGPAVPSSS